MKYGKGLNGGGCDPEGSSSRYSNGSVIKRATDASDPASESEAAGWVISFLPEVCGCVGLRLGDCFSGEQAKGKASRKEVHGGEDGHIEETASGAEPIKESQKI